MKPQVTLFVLLGAALLALWSSACGSSGGSPTTPLPPPQAAPPPTPDPTASYRVVFDATWSAATHPTMIPSTPHFSGLIGATHRAGFRFWSAGSTASNGIEAMAELGSKTPLDNEIAAAMASGQAQHLLSGGGIARSPGSVALEFTISLDQPEVSLVSMLAPSPDWFVGVSAMSLLENGDWVDERVVELEPWDAGTDSGTTYESRDADTVPRGVITLISGPPLATGGRVPPVGTFTFRRLR